MLYIIILISHILPEFAHPKMNDKFNRNIYIASVYSPFPIGLDFLSTIFPRQECSWNIAAVFMTECPWHQSHACDAISNSIFYVIINYIVKYPILFLL